MLLPLHDRASAISRRALLGAMATIAVPRVTRATERAFTIGLLGTREPPELALKTLRRTMERAIARSVAFEVFARGERLVEAAATGRIALSVHTALTYAAARTACDCLVPLARPVTAKGEAGMRAVVIVRREGAVRRIGDLAGGAILGTADASIPARVARFGLRQQLAGKAPPLHIGVGARPDMGRFTAGAGDALVGHELIDRFGQAIAGSGTLGTLGGEGTYAVVWRSAPIWHGPVALHRSREPLIGRLREVLLSMPSGGAETIGLGLGRVSMTPARREEYDLLPVLLRADG